MEYKNSKSFAKEADRHDPLSDYRSRFLFPTTDAGEECLYLCGNSLGLQPKTVKDDINDILDHWSDRGVEGHFEGEKNWIGYIDKLKPQMANLVGAKDSEIAIMNTLSVNLHLLLISFYRPNEKRYKILIEAEAFPSDKYIVHSQARFHGYDPSVAVVELKGKDGGLLIRAEDVQSALHEDPEIGLILLGGLNYVTGQYLPIKAITEIGHQYGCIVGFDMAHAVGNVPMDLHNSDVDFAAWCTYKYLNAGPGAIASVFIHEKHHDKNLPRLEGWWGTDYSKRFLMEDTFTPALGAEAWVMSTPPTLAIAAIKSSLDLFEEVGLNSLRVKSIQLTGFLEFLLTEMDNDQIQIITPHDPKQRGAQLSIKVNDADKSLFTRLTKEHVMVDWREPNIIRITPVPFYNSFADVFELVQRLKKVITQN